MYSIFAPLDADEPLPRELLMAGRRYRSIGRWELAGALWLPAVALILTLATWAGIPPLLTLALVASAFGGLLAYALAGHRSRRPK
jgi:hypothetical protein